MLTECSFDSAEMSNLSILKYINLVLYLDCYDIVFGLEQKKYFILTKWYLPKKPNENKQK